MIATALLIAAFVPQDDPEPIRAKVGQLSYLVGRWEGKIGEAWVEEVWTAPKDGVMHGSFRIHQDGKLIFSGSERIVEENGFVYLRIKNFDEKFVSSQEKDEVVEHVLIKVSDKGFTFYHQGNVSGTYFTYVTDGETAEKWYSRDGKRPAEISIEKLVKVD